MNAAPNRAELRPPYPPRILHIVEDKPQRPSWMVQVCERIEKHVAEQYQRAGDLRDWGRK